MGTRKKRKPKEKILKCKKCGFQFKPTELKPNKTWTNVSPMPDKDGNVTITQMAVWSCPECGATIRGAMGKTKGEFSGKSKKEILIDRLNSGENVSIADVSKELGFDPRNVEKIISVMIKKGQISGEIKDGIFNPSA